MLSRVCKKVSVILVIVILLFPFQISASAFYTSSTMDSILAYSPNVQQYKHKKAKQAQTFSTSLKDVKKAINQTRKMALQSKKAFNSKLNKVNNRQVLIKLKEAVQLSEIIEKYQLSELHVSNFLKNNNYFLLKVPESFDFQLTLQQLQQDANVLSAEPDYQTKISYQPTDPDYNKQWYIPKINLPQAWDLTVNPSREIVAVLDTGVNRNHQDLSGRILTGYDFINFDSDPEDDHGHGTFIAGIIAANSNQIGITGVNLTADILPVKIANEEGFLTDSSIVSGIYYAIEKGATIINMSFTGYEYHPAVEEALWEAHNNGIVLVASSGNDSTDEWSYPASYDPVISVGSSNKSDNLSNFSNRGSTLDIIAPGEDIFSSTMTGGYSLGAGTSFAAPIISGIAAIIKSNHPDWSPEQIEWALEQGATQTNTSKTWSYYSGYGRINALTSLEAKQPDLTEDFPNLIGNSSELAINTPLNGMLELPLDVDWVKFQIGYPTEATIHVNEGSADYIKLIGYLIKMDGDTITGAQIMDNLSTDSSYHFYAEPGTYYLALFDYYNHWSTEPYSLSVTVNPVISIPNVSLPSSHHYPLARLHIRQSNVSLLKKEANGKFTPYKFLNRGEFYRVYGVDGQKYHVGGSYYVQFEENKMSVYIARTLILQDTPLYKPDGSIARMLRKGEAIKTYDYDEETYKVGAGYYIEKTDHIKYFVGYLTILQDTMLYTPTGNNYKMLKQGSKYFVYSITNNKFDLGGGYYVIDKPANIKYMKN